jgi:GAF domain-containing protein
LLSTIIQVAQNAPSSESALAPIATAFGKNFVADGCILQLVEKETLTGHGSYSAAEPLENWLEKDPMVREAIASQKIQVSVNVPADASLSDRPHYTSSGIQAHLIVPVTLRGELLAVLSLQWKQPCTLREDELLLLHLSAQQIALALTCSHYPVMA